ncbi:ubiquitin protein ligase E3 component (N-recognin), putative [Theileria annulata]|uniref:E3 ubiquitin-protein ligase n=1 Tax=Theileria annulata TaxID=5874 RepID=Q4U9F3_THEAN|nr:ubiquitin protein ligase E3 component (N-recognin), putative [Theileria annulata]CAI76550.1 ubiquitin protein ligase E3 component (N-recognin), putative [Theileria annulata]|eukprot:XP_953175.1 ubiquitin protein ligase E3 component (N-recognin), putative [Theileria annulata]
MNYIGDDQTQFIITNILNSNKDINKDHIFDQLYTYLYGISDKNYFTRLINNQSANLGFCTNKWLQETVAIKCYDCEYDSTCAVCLECFFNSDHTSHEYRLTRTSGGCCDCGDVSSWNFNGSCKNHTHFVDYDERTTLSCFTNSFLLKLESLLTQIIYYITEYLKNIHIIDEYSLQILILFLNDLVKVSSSYRFALNLCLSKDVLKDWILKHQILSNDIQKSFNSLYLTLLTSMAFKMKFATLFASLYIDIVQPLKEIPDGIVKLDNNDVEWHLSNLSVQLFTYSTIANELFKNEFLNYCIEPIMDKNLLDKRLNKIQFTRFDRKKFSLYIRILSDITYLFNHKSVCEIVLSNPNIQNTVLRLLATHNQMNLIEREEYEHVSYENSGYSIAFTIEHTIHSALKPLSDYCKNLPIEKTNELLKFYKNINDFIFNRLLKEKNHSEKLARSFHIPFVRFFTYLVDFNFVRKCLISNLKRNKDLSEYLDLNFPDLKSESSVDYDILSIFDNEVLMYILRNAIEVIKFSMEIKQNLWVYNGESMHEQRTNYYELLFDTYDIAAIQISVCLLAMKNIGKDLDLISVIFDICVGSDEKSCEDDTFGIDPGEMTEGKLLECDFTGEIIEVSSRSTIVPEDETAGNEEVIEPGDMQFKLSFFFMIMNTLINDIKHIEILSIPKKTMKEEYVKRGLPLLKMDVVYALVSGNAEFGKVVNETKKHWKHHPKVVETIEDLASLNYSKVSDKTYVRLKPDSYKMIDILWNPQYPITHSVCKNSLKENISLLGSCVEVMSREYNETQDIILNSISCNRLLKYIFVLISNYCKMHFKHAEELSNFIDQAINSRGFNSLVDLYNKIHLNENQIKIICINDMKEYSECILYSLKILNLFLSKMPLPPLEVGKFMVNSLELVHKNMDDEIYKKCLSYTILKMKRIYMIDDSVSDLMSKGNSKDVKLIQKQMIQRLCSQNTMFSNEIEEEEVTTEANEDDLVCILCKQVMDSMSNMSYMTFVSTNNVLRRCSTSHQNKNYSIYARSSMPLKSSIITTCGHIAHTKCINEHRKVQTDNHIFSMYGIQKSKNEFFCPVCKLLCNYTLNITTIDSMKNRRGLFCNRLRVDSVSSPEYENVNVSHSSTDRSQPETPDCTPYMLMCKQSLDITCNWSWRHPYTTNWINSPVYASFEEYPLYVYGLVTFANNIDLNYFLSSDMNVQDEHALSYNISLPNIECTTCTSYDLATIERNCCSGFKRSENRLVPKVTFQNLNRLNKVDMIFEYFMTNLDCYRDCSIHKYINMNGSKLVCTEFFPRVLTSSYAIALFSKNRLYFGIQNWKHVNSTVKLDPKFWVFYNEILNVTTLRRNTLNIQNPLYAQLIRNYYFKGLKSSTHYALLSERNIVEHNIILDETYHDVRSDLITIPQPSLYYEKSLSDQINIIRIFIESLSDSHMYELYESLNMFNSSMNEIRQYSFENERFSFFDKVMNTNHDTSWIKSLQPLKKYFQQENDKSNIYKIDDSDDSGIYNPLECENINIYKMFGNDLLVNPWSCDFMRDFLLFFFSTKYCGKDSVMEHLYYYLMVGTMQVMDRFLIDIVEENYVEFIDTSARTDKFCLETRNKRDFLKMFSERFFREFYENAEFPVDPISRLNIIDFNEHVDKFREYNGYTNVCEETVYKYPNKEFRVFNEMLEELISYSSLLRSIHYSHVDSFTEEIPKITEFTPQYDNKDLDNYLVKQVSRLVKVRDIQNNLNNSYDVNAIIETLKEYVPHKSCTKRTRIGNFEDRVTSLLDDIFIDPVTPEESQLNTEYFYKGVDLARRVNKLLYKNHSNSAFFETLKHHIPDSIHILDFFDNDFFNEMPTLEFGNSFFNIVETVFNKVLEYLKSKGYIRIRESDLFGRFKNMLFESMNLFLDVSFWTINSIYAYDNDLRNKLVYSNMYNESTRFLATYEALGLQEYVKPQLTKKIIRMLFTNTYKNQMRLNRNCNMEVTPPIVTNYALIKIDKYLDELNWQIIKTTSFRNCANCGSKPANPLICLLCGSLLCSNSECCQKVKISDLTRFISELDKKSSEFKRSDVSKIYYEEILAHSNVCGGGQCIYFSPYYCFVLYVDERRRCVVQSLYSDKYGNSDLHGKVYDTVRLSQVRIENIVNTLCSGRLSNEIVSQRKLMLNSFN